MSVTAARASSDDRRGEPAARPLVPPGGRRTIFAGKSIYASEWWVRLAAGDDFRRIEVTGPDGAVTGSLWYADRRKALVRIGSEPAWTPSPPRCWTP
jgi:hypothetical protein